MTTTITEKHRPMSAHDEIRGWPASGGRAIGPARVLRSPNDGALLQPGEIIVCATLAPEWAPLFKIAGGIITETGGALASAAIIARECGIPAIVGAKDATSRIRDGRTVAIDGATGVAVLSD